MSELTPDARELAAQALAEVVNGGKWDSDYTPDQKQLWRRRVDVAMSYGSNAHKWAWAQEGE